MMLAKCRKKKLGQGQWQTCEQVNQKPGSTKGTVVYKQGWVKVHYFVSKESNRLRTMFCNVKLKSIAGVIYCDIWDSKAKNQHRIDMTFNAIQNDYFVKDMTMWAQKYFRKTFTINEVCYYIYKLKLHHKPELIWDGRIQSEKLCRGLTSHHFKMFWKSQAMCLPGQRPGLPGHFAILSVRSLKSNICDSMKCFSVPGLK